MDMEARLSRTIDVIAPDNELHSEMDVRPEDVHHRRESTAFYNEVALAYNLAAVGSILLVPLPRHIRMFNLKQVMLGRGLREGADFMLARMTHDTDGNALPRANRPTKLKKCSAKNVRIIDVAAAQDDYEGGE